jgi:hypothetical protein
MVAYRITTTGGIAVSQRQASQAERQAELICALGAVVIILGDVFFGLFSRDYFTSDVIWATAALTLVTVAGRAHLPEAWAANRMSVLLGAALVAGLLTLRTMVGDIQVIAQTAQLPLNYLLGMVGLYVGALVMAYGAWQAAQRRSS